MSLDRSPRLLSVNSVQRCQAVCGGVFSEGIENRGNRVSQLIATASERFALPPGLDEKVDLGAVGAAGVAFNQVVDSARLISMYFS
jgi:hypothetical protein